MGRRGPKPGTMPPPQSLANLALGAEPFPPGVSANPGGRPKDPAAKAVRSELDLPCDLKIAAKLGFGPDERPTKAQALARKWTDQAFLSLAAYRETVDRAEGKARQRVELTGDEGGPVQIEDVHARLREKLLKK